MVLTWRNVLLDACRIACMEQEALGDACYLQKEKLLGCIPQPDESYVIDERDLGSKAQQWADGCKFKSRNERRLAQAIVDVVKRTQVARHRGKWPPASTAKLAKKIRAHHLSGVGAAWATLLEKQISPISAPPAALLNLMEPKRSHEESTGGRKARIFC